MLKLLDVVAATLVIIGAINWGCIGFFDWNLVNFFFKGHIVEKVIYAAVGVAGIWQIFSLPTSSKRWRKK